MPNDSLKIFAERLREAREDAHLSKAELAKLANISKSMMTSYEDGETDPRQSLIMTFSKLLGVEISWLMGSDSADRSSSICQKIEFLCMKLNDEGQNRILGYAQALIDMGDYNQGFTDSNLVAG